jgi:hypothetical protein
MRFLYFNLDNKINTEHLSIINFNPQRIMLFYEGLNLPAILIQIISIKIGK